VASVPGKRRPTLDGSVSAFDNLDRRRFLKGTVGAAATAAAIPALSGLAAAHFPSELAIDVQPENEDNVVELDADDTVPVAVLPSEFLSEGERRTFDPTERERRYRLGPWSASEDGGGARPVDDGEIASMEVGHGEAAKKRDGLLLEFPVGETELDSTDDVAWLFWDRDESREHGLAGFDAVTILGGEPSGRDLAALLRELIVTLIGR
jgi:hypothetical protein